MWTIAIDDPVAWLSVSRPVCYVGDSLARKATHGLDGQHQDMDRTLHGRISQNDRGQGQMEKGRPWCDQPSDRGQLKNRTEHE